ncbi:MAG: hypothetical protein LAO06_20340 [Acidobacteriia bacterium]|nr:hypothetical protein [Terriglobia bacterium]
MQVRQLVAVVLAIALLAAPLANAAVSDSLLIAAALDYERAEQAIVAGNPEAALALLRHGVAQLDRFRPATAQAGETAKVLRVHLVARHAELLAMKSEAARATSSLRMLLREHRLQSSRTLIRQQPSNPFLGWEWVSLSNRAVADLARAAELARDGDNAADGERWKEARDQYQYALAINREMDGVPGRLEIARRHVSQGRRRTAANAAWIILGLGTAASIGYAASQTRNPNGQ